MPSQVLSVSFDPSLEPSALPSTSIFSSVKLSNRPSVIVSSSSMPSQFLFPHSLSYSVNSPSSSPLTENLRNMCSYKIVDFETNDRLVALTPGSYVKYEWFEIYGLTLSASAKSGLTPDDRPRIFDSANPGANTNLGSPNIHCTPSGGGFGAEGGPTSEYSNCLGEGLVLIIQETSSSLGLDDDNDGGTISFHFDSSANQVFNIGLLGMGPGLNEVVVLTFLGDEQVIIVPAAGTNALQRIAIDATGVSSVTVRLSGPGAIADFSFCVDLSDATGPSGNPTTAPNKFNVLT